MSNELKVELSCGRCNFTKVISIGMDEDGVFTIPNKFCPNDLNELEREVLHQLVSVPESKPEPELNKENKFKGIYFNKPPKPDEPTEDKTRVSNTVSKPVGILDVPKHGVNRPKKT